MKLYTIADLNQGSGLFDHVMRTSGAYPSRHEEMPGEVGIGFIAAAIAAGLDREDITDLIHDQFEDKTAGMLETLLSMYLGKDSRIHLWNGAGEGRRNLNGDLQYYSKPRWTLDTPPRINGTFGGGFGSAANGFA